MSGEPVEVMNPVGYLKTGVIHCDDNRRLLAEMPADCVDLVYLDPPFFSNRNYEVIWGDEAEVRSFEDRWEGGIQVYINWMGERIREIHRVLKPTGTMYFHCDWHAGHYLKVMCDQIFGQRNFRNEIVWCYAGGGVPKRDFPRKHDTIFRYTKGDEYFFEPVYRPYSEGTVQRGRTAVKGKYFEEGLRSEGTPINDWWTDVPKITSPTDPEKLGYPTQKPEALLERIISVSSRRGDIVLDPFCGCGTAIAVAYKMERQWIGMDISPTAMEIMRRRLEKLGATVDLEGLPVTEEDLRALRPFEFQNWVINRISGTHSPVRTGDMGIDGYSFMEHLPIQVKQSERVGRNVVDNFETAVERAGKHKGYIVAFSFTRGAHEEAARARASKGMQIELVRVSTLLEAQDQPTPDLMSHFPELPDSFLDLPLPRSRPKKDRPSADQLVRSDQHQLSLAR